MSPSPSGLPSGSPPSALGKARRYGLSGKNDPSFFSLRYFQENHADVLCTPLILICMASMWQKTHSGAVRFFWPSNTSPVHEEGSTQYGPCRYDGLLIAFYTVLAICVHSLTKVNITDRLVKGCKLSWARQFALNRILQRIVFETLLLSYAVYVWYYVSDNGLDMRSLPAIEPTGNFSIFTKFLLLFDVCYWTHWPIEIYFDVAIVQAATRACKQDETRHIAIMSLAHCFVRLLCYYSGYWTLGVALLSLEYAGALLVRLIRCADILNVESNALFRRLVRLLAYSWYLVCWTLSAGIVATNLPSARRDPRLVAHLVASAVMLLTSLGRLLRDVTQAGAAPVRPSPTTPRKMVTRSKARNIAAKKTQ